MNAVACLLLDTADLLRREGWIQGAFWRDGEGYSLERALGLNVAHTEEDWAVYIAAYDRVAERIGTDNLAAWNDEPGRMKDQVLAVLEAA